MEKYCPPPEMQEQFAELLVQEEQRARETGISDSTQQRKARFTNFSLPLNKTPPHLPLFACKCRGNSWRKRLSPDIHLFSGYLFLL